jgi:hypothetical protein
MPALDLRGFVSPASTFEGVDALTGTLVRQQHERAVAEQQRKAKAAASTKFFSNYLDEKQKFTGTKYDPVNHQLLSDALNDAVGLIREGADDTDILAAISPKVNKVNQYTNNAQTYSANKKAYIERMKGTKGIDLEKLNSEIDSQAFPEGVDISQVDPNINYGDMALKNGDIYNTEGFDEAFTKAPKNTETGIVKYTNKKGGIQRDKVKLISPYYAMSEKDADGNHVGFVPKHQIAKEEGNELIMDWDTEHGKVKAPIRLYDEELFDAMPTAEKAYLLQETRKYAKQKGIDPSSVQAKNFARALAYDEKKARINGTFEHIEETKENPIKIYTGGGSKPTQGEIKAALSASDLKKSLDGDPVDASGRLNVSEYINGITYLTNSKNKRISQPEIFFDPKDKTFTYTDDEGISKTISFEKFKSIATTNGNPGSDMSFLEGFRNYKRSGSAPAAPPPKKNFFQEILDFVTPSGTPSKQPSKKAAPTKKDPLGIL